MVVYKAWIEPSSDGNWVWRVYRNDRGHGRVVAFGAVPTKKQATATAQIRCAHLEQPGEWVVP